MINFFKPQTKQLFTITLKKPKPLYSLSAKHLLWVGIFTKDEKIVLSQMTRLYLCTITRYNKL